MNGFEISPLWASQGAAFDLPDYMAEEIMGKKEELTSRGFKVDMPVSLPVEQTSLSEDRGYGNGRGGYGGQRGGYGQRNGRSNNNYNQRLGLPQWSKT